MHSKSLLSLIPLCLLVACGWVDSTGREGNSAPVTQISFFDGQQAESTQIDELSSILLRVTSSDSDGSISRYQWSEQPVEQGALSLCASQPDFNMNIAATSLQDACASSNECSLVINQQVGASDDDADFLISAPNLSAPVGVTYELTVVDNEGGVGTQLSTFCLIAINAAPEAVDDEFTVLEGQTLDVDGSSQRNLLTNDSDDIHVLNNALSVLITPKNPPANASMFSLRANGGFTYVPLPARLSDNTTDSFEYWITDGVHEPVSAAAVINIVAIDDPPEQTELIPLIEAVAGVAFAFDLSPYFEDPEGSDLSFAIVGGSLPRSGALQLSVAGVLSGSAEVFDEGSYTINVAASDGSSGVVGNVNLTVSENLPVDAVSIAAQSVDAGDTLLVNVSDSFDDPENQSLIYSVDTEFDDAELSMNARTGVLSAVFNDDGRFVIDVSADDGINLPTSIRFSVTVILDNTSPVFRGAIESQIVELGSAITPISGIFSDADDDVLEYEVIGVLPTGLSLSTAGVISGIPLRLGSATGIRLVATDPFDEFARSNAFAITVIAAVSIPVDTAPVFVDDTVFNQSIELSASIQPIRPEFTDVDGDDLEYSIIGGVLPIGVTINTSTGVISGAPRAIGWSLGLQVVATDADGESASSGEFWIRVF